jgi:hypothetical protein
MLLIECFNLLVTIQKNWHRDRFTITRSYRRPRGKETFGINSTERKRRIEKQPRNKLFAKLLPR